MWDSVCKIWAVLVDVEQCGTGCVYAECGAVFAVLDSAVWESDCMQNVGSVGGSVDCMQNVGQLSYIAVFGAVCMQTVGQY